MTAHASHGTPSMWRLGCRKDCCRVAHNLDLEVYRRARTEAAFPPAMRKKVLRLIRRGENPTAAAQMAGTTHQRIYHYAEPHPDWKTALDDALMEGRDPDLDHGTPGAYRHGRCRCPECRAAHQH